MYELTTNHNIQAQLNFVIQRANYHDIPNFINLAKHYKFRMHFALLEDWQTFGGTFYENNAVHLENHPEYNQWKEIYTLYRNDINLGR